MDMFFGAVVFLGDVGVGLGVCGRSGLVFWL